eukprot:6722535-Lingulodinium_polyedra.AAC.1
MSNLVSNSIMPIRWVAGLRWSGHVQGLVQSNPGVQMIPDVLVHWGNPLEGGMVAGGRREGQRGPRPWGYGRGQRLSTFAWRRGPALEDGGIEKGRWN